MEPRVYILANQTRGTLYTGVTSNLTRRIWLHREGIFEGFTKQYGLTRFVWYRGYGEMAAAIADEKRIKRWRRAWKIELVEEQNPDWRDLWFDIAGSRPTQPSSRKAEGLSGTHGQNGS